MKKFLVAVALLACVGGVAIAGPNLHGTIFAHDANLVYTDGITNYCGQGLVPAGCAGADLNLEGSGLDFNNAKVFKVYAAFCDPSQPRLKAIAFGINYDPVEIKLLAWGNCAGDPNQGASEISDATWPNPNTGTAIVFQFTQTDLLEEVYWFAGYSYYNHPTLFETRSNPSLGGVFADDNVPSNEDPIAGYGTMGFDAVGVTACPTDCGGGPPTGACCVAEVCTVTTEADCAGDWKGADVPCEPDNPCLFVRGACCLGDPGQERTCVIDTRDGCVAQGGEYMGDNVPCDPDPCNIIPVESKSWGQIKANYR